jgi:crossover junction endodeoxyribonuclease RusA
MLNFFVSGRAAPQGSKEYKGHRGGKPILVDQCKGLPAWKSAVKLAATKAMFGKKMLVDTPVFLTCIFFMPRPKAHYRSNGELKPNAPVRCLTSPDLTKIVRSTEDSMTGTVYDDDSRVVTQSNEKFYERPGIGPGVHIMVNIADDMNDNYWLDGKDLLGRT